jgi:hypothetical protein
VSSTRLRGDAGSGVVSALAGVAAFLAFLLLAAHVIIGLYAVSVVTDAAPTGARAVAGAASSGDDEAAAAAEVKIRAALGGMGADAEIRWHLGADSVGVTVRVERPGLVPVLPGRVIERTVTARREALR